MIKKIVLISLLLFPTCTTVYAKNPLDGIPYDEIKKQFYAGIKKMPVDSRTYLSAGTINCSSIKSAKKINQLIIDYVAIDKQVLRNLNCRTNWKAAIGVLAAEEGKFVYVVYKMYNGEVGFGWIDKRFLMTVAQRKKLD